MAGCCRIERRKDSERLPANARPPIGLDGMTLSQPGSTPSIMASFEDGMHSSAKPYSRESITPSNPSLLSQGPGQDQDRTRTRISQSASVVSEYQTVDHLLSRWVCVRVCVCVAQEISCPTSLAFQRPPQARVYDGRCETGGIFSLTTLENLPHLDDPTSPPRISMFCRPWCYVK